MHRVALKHGISVAGKPNTFRGWSVLSNRTMQRSLSNGPDSGDSAGGGGQNTGNGGDAAAGGQQGVGGAARSGERTIQPNGRGRGAFSQFLRTHERKIGKQLRKIDEFPEDDRGGESVSGQFDDSEEGSGKKSFSGSARDDGALFEKSPPKMEHSGSSSQDDKWQEQWFAHEDKRIDRLGLEVIPHDVMLMDLDGDVEDELDGGDDMGGDIPELDDCEEDDHFGAEEEWADPVWTGYAPEQIEEFKILGARLEEEESKQMADLRSRWKKTKEASEREHGTAEHLELPDIIIKHEMTYEAPQGEANADRAMPLPRPLAKIVDSMQLPSGLDVTPDDPEYEQVVNMWKSVSRNNTMDERMKKSIISQISTFIAKHRNSDAFEKALETQDIPEERGRRQR